MTLSDPNPGF